MAETKKASLPYIATNNWWALRNKFKQSIPQAVTGTYLSAFLSMSSDSAQNNLIPPLKTIGLIDEEGKPTERAKRWRDDEQYPAVCEEIRHQVYPQELLDAFPDTSVDRSKIEKWIANYTGMGEAHVRRMTSLYVLLCEADPTPENSSTTSRKVSKTPSTPAKSVPSRSRVTANAASDKSSPVQYTSRSSEIENVATPSSDNGLSLHIDIQIHISPEASPEQIEQIFASMSKHLSLKRRENE
jgi:hypothetical protein